MLITDINKLKNKKISIFEKDLRKEDLKKIQIILKDFYSVKIIYNNISKNTTKLFFNPVNYYKNKSKNKILLALNFCDIDGKIENLYQLNKFKLIKKKYNDETFAKKFRKFLLEKLEKKGKSHNINFINFILLKFNLRLAKYYFNKKLYFPYLTNAGYFKEIVDGRKIASLSSYNCFFLKNHSFLKLYYENYKKLSDKKSKEIYKKILFDNPVKIWRMYISNIFKPNQYFDYIKLDNNSVILNCGVSKGFEIPQFLTYGVKKIFNVDPSGIKHLHPYVKNYVKIFNNRLKFIEKAMYTSERCYIHNNNKTTSLHELIKNLKLSRLDLIKTDIEGAEKMLIDELEPVIYKYRPQLSISIYHVDNEEKDRFSHLVSLPNKLIKICKNYKFYIKHYSFDRRETIMYCIPN